MTAASAALAASSEESANTVMYALSVPSRAAIRSTCACTTSTGDVCLEAISRASSVIGCQTRSVIGMVPDRGSEDAVLGRGLDLAQIEIRERLHQGAAGLHEREELLQFLRRELEPL